jgi:hypothetical protein
VTPRTLPADLVVCGGGVAGTMAAVAAGRAGARVLLVERYGFLGGNATAGAVAQFNSWQTAGGRRVVAGLADEVVQRLRTYAGAGAHEVFTMSTGHRMDRVSYAPEVLKLVLDDMVTEAGVQPLFHAQLLDVQTAPDAASPGQRQITGLRVLTKGGVLALQPRLVLDTSGDLDAMQAAGAEFLALEEGEALQPATLMFRFGPIDHAVFDAIPKDQLAALARKGFDEGQLARVALHSSRDPYSADSWFNIGRLAIDATDPLALGAAEIEGRRQAWRAAAFLRAQVPGCGQGQLRAFATQVGVRETRRIHGEHVLTAQELLQPVAFDDAIAAGAYPIDIHPTAGGGLDYRGLGDDHAYQIPYRSLVPRGLANALVAGRGVSASHTALAAIRVMTISMAVGQAAGTAAGLLLGSGSAPVQVRQVSRPALRAALASAGAILA